MSKIKEILKGIDRQQIDSECGWWETSEQARFGAEKLQEVERLINELLLELERTRSDMLYYGFSDFNKTIEAIDKAIANAKGE